MAKKNTTIYTYIKYDVPGFYIEFNEQFDPDLYDNIGTTWEDFLNNLWVLLSDEQVAFHNENPSASITEVWNMELAPDTVENHRAMKNAQIYEYDLSTNVNNFTINGENAWLTPTERTNYRNSIDSAKLLGVDVLYFPINGKVYQLSPANAEMFLSQIQLYADQAFMVTQAHYDNVAKLQTIEAVDAYDYTTGYPEQLEFMVNEAEVSVSTRARGTN